MQVHFYIHEDNLDKLNKFINGTSDELNEVSIYRKKPTQFVDEYTSGFLHISIGYNDYVKVTDKIGAQ